MTRCVLFSYDIKRLLFNTLFGFFLMMAMLGNGYAAPTILSTTAELERYGLVVNEDSGWRLTMEGTNMVQIHLYQTYLPNPIDRPYQVTTDNGVVSIEIESGSEAHVALESMESQLNNQFLEAYNEIISELENFYPPAPGQFYPLTQEQIYPPAPEQFYPLTQEQIYPPAPGQFYPLTQEQIYPPTSEQINDILSRLLSSYTRIVVPRFATHSTLHAPIETADAAIQTGSSQIAEAATQTDPPQTANAEIQTGSSQTAEAATQTDTPQTVNAEIQIGSSQTTDAEIQTGSTQIADAAIQTGSTQTAEAGIQIGSSQIAEAETQIDTLQTAGAETTIDSTPAVEDGIQTGASQTAGAETPTDSTSTAEEEIPTGTSQTAGAETYNDESAIQADAETPTSVQTATEEAQTVTEIETTAEEQIVNAASPIVTPLLAVAPQCGGEDHENGGGNNENNVPGIFTQSWQQIVFASRAIANGVTNISKRLASGAISKTRSLGNGVVGVTKYLGREASKTVSYLYNLASGIVKPVLSAHNKSKKQTSRRLGRARRAKAAPLLTTFHYAVFSAIAGITSVAGYYYWDSVNNNQRSTVTSLHLLGKAKYFKDALEEQSAKKQKEIALLIERFSQSRWEKHHFPITAIYEKDSHKSYIDDYLHGWQNCQSLRFGMIGYNPATEEVIEPSDHSGPNFPVSHKQFSRWVTKTVSQLFDKISELLNPEDPAVIDTIAQTLMLCGIPIGKPGQAMHKECVATVADIIGKNGIDWYQKGMHIHSMHNTQRHELTGHQASLTFVPNFTLNQHCTHLDKLSYAPRIRQSADAPFPSLNKPFFADSGQTFEWSPDDLPEQFNLLYYHLEEGWTLDKAYNNTSSTMELNMGSIYGIQAEGEDTPSRILAFTNRQMIESHPAGTKTETQDGSVIHWFSSAPGTDRYWLYQQNDMEEIRSQRVRQDTMSYLNSVKQTQLANVVKAFSVFSQILLFDITVRRYRIVPKGSGLSPLLDVFMGFSVFGYHELLVIPLRNFMHRPPYADPEQEAAGRYHGLKQLHGYYLNDQQNYPHHNLLTSLLSDTEAPLGVIRYWTENVDNSNKRLTADYYEPLSYMSFKQQRTFFDKAVERCARYFGRNSCDPQNREHLDFIQFYLTICSTTQFESCEAMWKQSQSKEIWKIIVNQYDWAEIRYPLGILNSQFDTHGIVPVIRAYKRRPELDLIISKPSQGLVQRKLDQYQPKPPAPVLSVTGEKHTAFPELNSISAFDNETQSLWVLPWKETALIKMTNIDDSYSIHPVIINNNQLLPQTSNRMIKWYEDNKVRVKECHEVDFPNLFHLCKKVSGDNQKQFLIFLLNSRIKKSPWIAVYRPELEHGANPEKDLYFRFSDRIHFKDLSVDRLERHIDRINSFYGKKRSGMVKLIDSEILTESLAEVGLLILPSINEAAQNHFYEESYKLAFGKKEKPNNLFSDCIMDKLQKDQLCAESSTCVLMMQGWKLESSKNSYSHHPLPVWVQNGKVYNFMPVDNANSMAVTSDTTAYDQTMNTYVYDDGWQGITKAPLTSPNDSLIDYNQSRLYISSPEPVKKVFRRFDLTIYRNGQKYMDSCPGAEKP
ncbi:hypothetical protein NX722_03415 [Endozoicomonas gorgoniicola]|uniref:Uncharacterized protein n=1 Tax=Endozoicomonas gorgoniicola TaxID=1234144 RepID=A0ABT3MQQ9_9GAMM|nr:hypothetical protein [Endozoicomonas gorgoniicola]MCW7551707.1 hypothetical protein [Endozoicomonas gorgoniicola]